MKYLKKAQNWNLVINSYGNNKPDTISEFIFNWITFNTLYNEFYDKSSKEFECIDFFVKKYLTNIDLVKEIKKYCANEYLFFIRNPINSFINSNDFGNQRIKTLNNVSSSTYQKNKAIIMILYQVRCNLVHGDKEFSYSDHDFEVVRNANKILIMIINIIFREYRNE